jgi:hypothetical protein
MDTSPDVIVKGTCLPPPPFAVVCTHFSLSPSLCPCDVGTKRGLARSSTDNDDDIMDVEGESKEDEEKESSVAKRHKHGGSSSKSAHRMLGVTDMLYMCIGFLPFADAIQFGLTHKAAYAVFKEASRPTVVNRAVLNRATGGDVDDLADLTFASVAVLMAHYRDATHLDLSEVLTVTAQNNEENQEVRDTRMRGCLGTFAAVMPKLTRVDCSTPVDAFLTVQCIPNLRHLVLQTALGVVDDEPPVDYPTMESVTVFGECDDIFIGNLTRFPNLTRLCIDDISLEEFYDDSEDEAVVGRTAMDDLVDVIAHSLRHLAIALPESKDILSLRQATNLVTLHLVVDTIDCTYLAQILPTMGRHLETMHLVGANVDDTLFLALATHCPVLTTLYLIHCSGQPTAAAFALHTLVSLHVSSRLITREDIIRVASAGGMPNLRNLYWQLVPADTYEISQFNQTADSFGGYVSKREYAPMGFTAFGPRDD